MGRKFIVDGFPIVCYGLPKQHHRIQYCHSCDIYCVSKYPPCVDSWRIRGEFDKKNRTCNIKKVMNRCVTMI